MPTENTTPSSSMLSDIIKASKWQETSGNATSADTATPTNIDATPPIPPSPGVTPPPSKKPRQPLPPGTILKAIGALFFTGVIFFASFLAYIVFNPGEAQFFIIMFGIDTKDVATLLRKFINGSFGIIMLVVSIVWMVALFRAIWTPREQKRKKILAWMVATLVGILLFSILTFWIFLFKKIGEIVWDGGVIWVYDNILYSNPLSEPYAQVSKTQNMIGPISLRYDIRGNAKAYEINNGIKIERYEINFDGAVCADGRSVVTGTNPKEEQWIICTFDQIKNYNVRGTYYGTDINSEEIEIPMDLQAVEIRGLIDIKEDKNISGEDIITLDARKLALLGDVEWIYENTGKSVKTPTITEKPSETPLFILLRISTSIPERIFLIQKRDILTGDATIELVQSTIDAKEYTMYLTGITSDRNSITDIEWSVNDGIIICRNEVNTCKYNFWNYGRNSVKVKILMSNGNSYEIEKDVVVEEPLRLLKHAQVYGSDNTLLNPEESYDEILKTYIIDSIIPPDTLVFDARDIVTENPGYELKEVRWKFSDGRTNIEKVGERVSFTISNTYRYTILGYYTFEKVVPWNNPEIKIAVDSITIDVERKTLIPRLTLLQTSDYIPTTVTVDASQSWSENNEIIKFIYNFGEGKQDAVGDAVQSYTYSTPGEKEIRLTIIDDAGNTASIKKVIVLKETPRTVEFIPSLSPWIVGVPVDFSITGDAWQVEEYTWAFSDNTPSQRGISVTHIFEKAWEYSVTVTATYADGTQRQATGKYKVIPWE